MMSLVDRLSTHQPKDLCLICIRYGLVVRIPGSHPGGPGSIPGVGTNFCCHSLIVALVKMKLKLLVHFKNNDSVVTVIICTLLLGKLGNQNKNDLVHKGTAVHFF